MWFFSEEQLLLQKTIQQFAQQELAPRIVDLDEQEGFHREAFTKMGDMGLLGLTVPEEEGGSGLGAVAATIVLEEMSVVDASTALSYLAHSILCVHQIACHGQKDQKKFFLPPLLKGDWIGGLGMSEADAGSDAFSMKTKAVRQKDHYLLDGSKLWITNGPVGDLFYCYAKTGPEKRDLSSFIIQTGMPGFSKGQSFSKLGMRASPTGELLFHQCQVPLFHRIGKENQSVQKILQNLDLERITISGISLGLARASIEVARRYAQQRFAFKKPIGSFQQIQERLSEASAWHAACRSLTYETAQMWDLSQGQTSELSQQAAQAKLQTAQMATQVALDAIQILGAYGYSKEFPVERFLRDAKLIEIGAGTNEILRLIIAKHMLGTDIVHPRSERTSP